MAKRNRKRRTFHLNLAGVGVSTLVVVMAAPWVTLGLLTLGNSQEATQIRMLEQEQRSQEESLRRCQAEWNRLTEPSRLDEAIARNGLSLRYAPPERTAFVAADGQVRMPETLRRTLAQGRAAHRTGDPMARVRR